MIRGEKEFSLSSHKTQVLLYIPVNSPDVLYIYWAFRMFNELGK